MKQNLDPQPQKEKENDMIVSENVDHLTEATMDEKYEKYLQEQVSFNENWLGKKTGDVPPTAFILCEDGKEVIVPLINLEADDKNELDLTPEGRREVLRQAAKELKGKGMKPLCIVISAQAFALVIPKNDKRVTDLKNLKNLKVSDQIDRVEVLVNEVSTRNLLKTVAYQIIVENDAPRKLDKEDPVFERCVDKRQLAKREGSDLEVSPSMHFWDEYAKPATS